MAGGCFGRLLNASPLGDAVPDPDFFIAWWRIRDLRIITDPLAVKGFGGFVFILFF